MSTGTTSLRAQRAERLQERIRGLGVDAMLVTDLVNIRYLTGFTGSNALVLVGPHRREFLTDFRYVTQVETEVDPVYARHTAPQDLVAGFVEMLGGGSLRLGFEDDEVSVRRHARLRELLPDAIELIGVERAVEELRRRKDPEELELIRAASRLADAALEQVLEGGLVGRTEREVALALEMTIRAHGAEAISFPPIVAAGPHGALPHASPRDVKIEPGQLVVIDWGACVEGYFSDCTRTFATGEVSEHAHELYATTLAAQLAGLEGVRVGAAGREVDAGARRVIEEAGYGERFGHGLGHGVGMAVHEAPRLSKASEHTLAAGDVVTVEPGIYVPGEAGVRIEDLVFVGEEGIEIVTELPKELRTVG